MGKAGENQRRQTVAHHEAEAEDGGAEPQMPIPYKSNQP